MSLVELKDREDIRLLRELIRRYHRQGIPRGSGAGRYSRYFVWVIDGYWCAGAWIHDNTPFRFIAQRFNIPNDNTYFLRRICKFCPIECTIDFLKALINKLREEGKEVLWTLGLDDHSNALYKKAGFIEVGKTPRTKHPVFVYKLR